MSPREIGPRNDASKAGRLSHPPESPLKIGSINSEQIIVIVTEVSFGNIYVAVVGFVEHFRPILILFLVYYIVHVEKYLLMNDKE